MATARGTFDGQVCGSNHGADDDLRKPSPMPWLVARSRPLIHRNRAAASALRDSLGNRDRETSPNTIALDASRLSGKLADSGVLLRTVRGLGYRLELAGTGEG